MIAPYDALVAERVNDGDASPHVADRGVGVLGSENDYPMLQAGISHKGVGGVHGADPYIDDDAARSQRVVGRPECIERDECFCGMALAP